MLGSIFLFLSIIVLYFETGSLVFFILFGIDLDFSKQLILWLWCYVAFSIKIPTFPFHLWLPEAHVEAPTAGSVILAALLLKLGGYGIIRVLIAILPKASIYFFPLVVIFSIISIVAASLTAVRQSDLKRIIAYSSIAHMNLTVLGLFSLTVEGIQGSIFLMLAHGIVSGALFFSIGVLYDKYHTRLLQYYGGLIVGMPVFTFYFLIFCLANIGFPGTCNFIGEVIILAGLVNKNFFVLFLASLGVILSVMYTMFLFNKVMFGNLKTIFITK